MNTNCFCSNFDIRCMPNNKPKFYKINLRKQSQLLKAKIFLKSNHNEGNLYDLYAYLVSSSDMMALGIRNLSSCLYQSLLRGVSFITVGTTPF